MAETQEVHDAADFESRLVALEKTIAELSRTVGPRGPIRRDLAEASGNLAKTVAMLEEVLPLVRRAAPLLDSPLAKMAHSPAAGVLGLFGGGRRG